jgi:hypothetical protein
MDFAAGVYLSEVQNPIPDPQPLTHFTVYVYTIYLFTEGIFFKGGRPEKERVAKVHKDASKIPT